MNSEARDLLCQFTAFSQFSPNELAEIEPLLYWRIYKKGQMLFLEGDPRDKIYFLTRGYVKYERSNMTGTMLYNDFIQPFDIFPYGGMFCDKEYHYSATAVTDIEIFYLPTEIFESLAKKNSRLMTQIIERLSHILEKHEQRLQLVSTSHACDRVLQSFSYLMTDLGTKEDDGSIVIQCPVTTTDIAKMAGTSRETVSRVLKDLKKDNIITMSPKTIIFHKPDFFQSMLH